MIKVAIDSGCLREGHAVRGIGVMVGEQIAALNKITKKQKDIKIEAFDFSTEHQTLAVGDYDVVHYPYFFPYSLTLPSQKYANKVVVTIQDLIPLIYPKHYPPGIHGRINLVKQKMRLRNVDAVITISETSKKDIVRFLGVPAEKIHVVYLAPKKIFKKLENGNWKLEIKKRYGMPFPFALYVGDVNYNKNIPGLIKACKLAKIPLVICGKHALEVEEQGITLKHIKGPRDLFRYIFNIPHPELAHFKGLVDEFRGNPDIIRTGFLTEKELVALYNLASVYIQPSFYEGFGLPVLEAMACGTPCVISKTNALVEIAGGAALIAEAGKPKEMADVIIKILKNPKTKKYLVEKGFENLRRFSWEKTAKELVKIYKSV